MSKLHVPYGAALMVLALLAGIWYQKAVDARGRLKLAADSAASAMERLNAVTTSFVTRVRADSARGARAEAALRGKDSTLRALHDSAVLAARELARQLPPEQHPLLDSLLRLDSLRISLVNAQRDTALELFHRAAAARDSLTDLVAGYQGQLRSTVAQLQRAARTPWFESKPVRLVEVVLAVKGAADLLAGR